MIPAFRAFAASTAPPSAVRWLMAPDLASEFEVPLTLEVQAEAPEQGVAGNGQLQPELSGGSGARHPPRRRRPRARNRLGAAARHARRARLASQRDAQRIPPSRVPSAMR